MNEASGCEDERATGDAGASGTRGVDELVEAASGLLFPSETDAPFEGYRFAGGAGSELTAEGVLKAEGLPGDTHVEKVDVDEFFAPVAEGDEDEAVRYRALVEKLRGALGDLQVLRVGKTDIRVFIVGRGASGEWMGLKTRVVET